ncbi:MAG TPA: Crp/Fnr family transcriptional regulator [Azospirillaceae bacterium]|nr:Crp/Fnr family transcriptional regulator [Azospirillaceae bacterium]
MESRNYILSSLSAEEEALIRPHLERVPLPHRMTFFHPDEAIGHVWFLESGCASLINVVADGRAVEVATIGNEGMVGAAVLLESDSVPLQCDMQIPGEGWRIATGPFKAAVRENDTLRNRLLRFTQAYFSQTAQTVACNTFHTIEERCARWLLMTRDRSGDSFPLTHEYLAIMLGVRRAGVTVVVNAFERAGFIQSNRGGMTILNPAGLEVVACDCYGTIRNEFDRLAPTDRRR